MQLRQIEYFDFRVISACFRKRLEQVIPCYFSNHLPLSVLLTCSGKEPGMTYECFSCFCSDRAGWEAPEKIDCTLQALIRGPKQILRPVLCLDPILTSSWHFLSGKSEAQTSLSQWAHAQKKHINVKTL